VEFGGGLGHGGLDFEEAGGAGGAAVREVRAARRDGADPADTGTPVTYTVDVLGGTLVITEHPDGRIDMTGPAVIVAEGTLDPAWLAEGPANAAAPGIETVND
ncbi:hypothetical protein ABTY23_16895, partial [Streptomyces sp. NPDC096068]